MIALVNQDRAEHGLLPLQHDPQLTTLAMAHSRDRAKHGFFEHESPTTGDHGDRFNLDYSRSA